MINILEMILLEKVQFVAQYTDINNINSTVNFLPV